MSDDVAASSAYNLGIFIAAAFWVPIYREFHFYFAHRCTASNLANLNNFDCFRFIHISAMYKYIHSLHHRNTDIEPFSGLCMHPLEHLYYFSCLGPSFLVFTTPFAFMQLSKNKHWDYSKQFHRWNGIHLLISPAASHSGWEDHFQSDQYHYLHHRFFECNYGTSREF